MAGPDAPLPPGTDAALRRRLEEAEETLRAIRDGEVDALVVRGGRADRIFTLQGGEHSYQAFMETMDHGAAALGAQGEVLYANAAFCGLTGQSLCAMQGKGVGALLPAREAERIVALLEPARHAKQAVQIALEREGGMRHYLAALSHLETGMVDGWALTLTDLTDRVRAEESLAAEKAARAIIASANEAVVVCDAQGRVTHANAAVRNIHAGELLGRPFRDAVRLVFADMTGLIQADGLIETALAGQAVQGIEAHAPDAPRSKDLLISAAPLSTAEGVENGCVITMVDLSQRKAAEKQQLLLMGELDHRVKNTLALVQALLSRTNEATIEGFKEVFAGRIQALAATHNLLAKRAWTTLTLGDIATTELAPYVPVASGRVELAGLDIHVAPRAAIALGMIFHELTTNAVKYGALSVPGGRVRLRAAWPADATQPAVIEWTESGGPAVRAPVRTGFGRTMITRSLQYAAEGGAELFFDPAGLRCVMRVPAADLTVAGV